LRDELGEQKMLGRDQAYGSIAVRDPARGVGATPTVYEHTTRREKLPKIINAIANYDRV
jgi:hypothetical protein